MKQKIKQIHKKFDALQQREKVMVSAMLFVLLAVAWQVLLFDQSAIETVKLKSQIKAQQQKNSAMKIEIAAYNDRAVNNPNVKLKKEQQQYLNKIEVLDTKLNKKMKGLINPKKMTGMLKDIFVNTKKLTLVSLEKQKTKPMFNFTEENKLKNSTENLNSITVTDNINGQENDGEAVVYRHPVKMVFTGSYLNAMNYLKSIEKMPWDLYWETVKLDVEQYPRARIVITVFTLSLKKGWVGV